MSQFATCLVLIVLSCLSPGPGSVTIISGQGQTTDVKVLDRGDDWQCLPMEERDRAKNEIHEISNSAISAIVALHVTLAMVHQDGGVLLLST